MLGDGAHAASRHNFGMRADSRTDDTAVATPRPGEVAIDARQLRPGVHVRLAGHWMDHPFLRGSFVIADDEQVRQLAALPHLPLFCELARCSVPPLARAVETAPPSADELRRRAEAAAAMARQLADKQARERAMQVLRRRLEVANAHYVHAAREVGAAIRGFEATPDTCAAQLAAVSAQSTDVLMRDAESALALIGEKGHADIGYAHALSVMTLSLLLAKEAGLDADGMRAVGIGALLHDIGKATIDPSLLRKADRSRFEETIYRGHCRAGSTIAQRAGGVPRDALLAVLHHHERADGSGWPDALAGTAIPLAARIVAIANRFDNLVNPSDARRSLSPSEALATMWKRESPAFDATLLQRFVRAMGVYPPGSLVQLADGRSGVVVAAAGSDDPLRPQVLVYDPGVPRRHAIIVDLAREADLRIERSLSVHERTEDEVAYLLPRRKVSWLQVGAAE